MHRGLHLNAPSRVGIPGRMSPAEWQGVARWGGAHPSRGSCGCWMEKGLHRGMSDKQAPPEGPGDRALGLRDSGSSGSSGSGKNSDSEFILKEGSQDWGKTKIGGRGCKKRHPSRETPRSVAGGGPLEAERFVDGATRLGEKSGIPFQPRSKCLFAGRVQGRRTPSCGPSGKAKD